MLCGLDGKHRRTFTLGHLNFCISSLLVVTAIAVCGSGVGVEKLLKIFPYRSQRQILRVAEVLDV